MAELSAATERKIDRAGDKIDKLADASAATNQKIDRLVEALLRRGTRLTVGGPDFYDLGTLRVDLRRTEALREGKPVPLSTKEFQLLRYLIEHRGRTLGREELLKEVWGYTLAPSTRTVDVHVAWLRQKLEADPKQPKLILTVHGRGYKFAA